MQTKYTKTQCKEILLCNERCDRTAMRRLDDETKTQKDRVKLANMQIVMSVLACALLLKVKPCLEGKTVGPYKLLVKSTVKPHFRLMLESCKDVDGAF